MPPTKQTSVKAALGKVSTGLCSWGLSSREYFIGGLYTKNEIIEPSVATRLSHSPKKAAGRPYMALTDGFISADAVSSLSISSLLSCTYRYMHEDGAHSIHLFFCFSFLSGLFNSLFLET